MSAGAGLNLNIGDATPLAARGEASVSRGEARAMADALAARMRERGVSRVMVLSDDPAHILRALEACDQVGADLTIAHTNLSPGHVAEIQASQGIELVVGETDEELAPSGQGSDSGEAARGRVFMMTSGTTGLPKIAEHSLQSLLAKAQASARAPGAHETRWLLTYQPTGFAGIQVILTAAISGGLIISPLERTPSGFFAAAKRWGATQISGTPTFWRSFLMAANAKELSLRQITLGGEAADQATLDRVKAAFPDARVTHVYASTEAGVVFAVHDGLAGYPEAWFESESSDGKRQGPQVRIRDGYLQIKTPNAMRGYVNVEQKPLQDDGWLITADLCEVRGDRVFILGRQDSTINVGGSKVYPLAVESFLLSLPGVIEARVYGEANPISGALVAAEVVIAEGEDRQEARARILAACRENLASYQVPRVFKIVDAIVTRASGKKG